VVMPAARDSGQIERNLVKAELASRGWRGQAFISQAFLIFTSSGEPLLSHGGKLRGGEIGVIQ
jgi:hypothetical protein